MALVVKDRVKEVTTTTGTSNLTLGGAVYGFQSFSVIGNGNTTYYGIYDSATGDWEVGVGTYSTTGPTLTRDTVLESSNSGSKVVFGAGTKDVFVTYPAERSVYLDAAGSAVTVLDVGTLGVSTANISTANITAGTISTTPTSSNDLVNKTYVDAIAAQGISYHTPVKYEVPSTTGNLTATYNNGASGVGATLTNAGTQAPFAPDGPTAQVGDRILIYNQTNAVQNGVYEVTVVGTGSTNWVLTRTSDANTYGLKSPTALGAGDAFYVTSGNTGAGETYVCNTAGTITFGTTAITFAQIASAQVYSAGTGLTLSNLQFSITPVGTAGTYGSASSVPVFTTNASGQVSSVTNTAIAISAGAVSGLAASATTDTTNASNITTGTLGSARLTGSYTGITGVGTLTAGTWNANTIGAAYGGTGITSYTVGDILYADGSTSLAKLADVATGNALLSGGVGTAPAWGKIGLQTHVSGTLQVANGGTGATTLTGYVYGNGTGAFTASTSIPNSATTATSANTASAIVARDASGNFSAGTITASLSGNASTATSATSATTATNLAGGVAGAIPYQSASGTTLFSAAGTSGQYLQSNGTTAPTWATLPTIGNGTLTMAVSGTGLSGSASFTANQSGNSTFTVTSNATSANTASTIVARDASGNFSAGTITATLSGSATQVSNSLTLATSGTGLSGSATFNGASAQTFTVTSNATSANTASTIVARDASGNFSAGTITATLSGSATSATTATNLAGGSAGTVPYQSAAGTTVQLAAGSSGQVLTSNGAAAPSWTTPATVNNGTLTLNVSGTGLSGSQTFTANQAGNATFTVTSNATSANTASTIVARDASGNFSAGTITATLSGNATNITAFTVNQNVGTANNPSFNNALLGTWAGGSGYSGLFYNGMATNDFIVMAGGTDKNTYISSWTGGTVYIRGGGNNTTFEIRVPGSSRPSVAGNTILDAGNYNSYAPTLTGTGASGTWGINISGNAATATTAANVNNGTLTLNVSGTGLSGSQTFTANQAGNATFTVTSNATSANTASTIVARDASGNFSAGTITATLSGSATSATTAPKTSATTVPASTAFSKWLFATTSTAGTLDWNDSTNTIPGVGTTLLLGSATNGPGGGSYYHPFNIEYAGIDGTGNVTQMAVAYGSPGNQLYMRGRYLGTWSSWVQFLNSGNYNSYSPTLTGGGASGTWGINVTGNAATATTLQTARTINGTSFNGSANITTSSWGTARDINGTSVDGSANYAIGRIYDTNYRRITNPGGAEYVTTTASVTGAIAVTLPVGMTGSMVSITIKIYEYVTNQSFEVHVGGYNYFGGTINTWQNSPFAYIIGNPNIDRRYTVRLGYNSTSAKAVIYIGELASVWSYPQVFVTEVQLGYSGQSVNWTNGWSIGFESSAFQNVTATISNCQVGYAVSTNTANSTVLRDGSGNFSAGTITATLSGNASTATTATTANALNAANSYIGTGFTAAAGTAYIVANRTSSASGQVGYNWAQGGSNLWWNYVDTGATTLSWYNSVTSTNVMTLTTGGALNTAGAITQNGSQVLTAGNYNSYAPTLTGTGASGTWGINVTGNAATATALQTARSINAVSFNGTADITVPRVRAIDDRTAAPADGTTGYATFGFGSWNNNNTAPYADFWLMRSYTDATGGSDNMVMFRKDTLGMRVWQQAYGSATAFATFKDVAWTDGTNASGTWSINVTGSAGSATTATTATTANALNTGNNYQVNSLGVGTAASGTAGQIRATSDIVAHFSDDRLKTKLGVIENALAKLKTLEGFYYHANETAQALGYEPVKEVGVSAQSVQQVMPEVVAPAPIDEQYLTVKYEKLLPLVIEAIKELAAEVDSVKMLLKEQK